MIVQQIRKAFSHISFYDKYHRYTNLQTKQVYESVTRLISKYKPPFRKDYWLAYKALQKLGLDVKCDVLEYVPEDHIYFVTLDRMLEIEQVLKLKNIKSIMAEINQEWKEASNFGRFKGTATHKHLEYLAAGKQLDHSEYEMDVMPFIVAAEKWHINHYHETTHLLSEVIVANDELQLAGQFDKLSQYEDGSLKLIDFKTDKNINKSGMYEFNYPLNGIPSSTLNSHFIQLNMYRYFITEATGIEIKEMEIVNFRDDGTYMLYEVPDWTPKIQILLMHEKFNKEIH